MSFKSIIAAITANGFLFDAGRIDCRGNWMSMKRCLKTIRRNFWGSILFLKCFERNKSKIRLEDYNNIWENLKSNDQNKYFAILQMNLLIILSNYHLLLEMPNNSHKSFTLHNSCSGFPSIYNLKHFCSIFTAVC